jgi:hypothetical protein
MSNFVRYVNSFSDKGNLSEKDHLGDPDVDGWIILIWIFRKWYVGVWTGSSLLRIGAGGVIMRMR